MFDPSSITKVIVKSNGKNYYWPINLTISGHDIVVRFGYHKYLVPEIKAMEGARWNPDNKFWTIKNTQRNHFQLRYLAGQNPYAKYDAFKPDLNSIITAREVYRNQREMIAHALAVRQCIWACEMGTGKSLAAIEAAEQAGCKTIDDCWYIGPRAGVYAVSRELRKWNARFTPRMMTYENLTRMVQQGVTDEKIPWFIIFDESQKIKTPTAKRSEAARLLANYARNLHSDPYIVLMTGTPAPKSPLDWWHQCEVACPGFLREGDLAKFKARLCIIEKREGLSGIFPYIVSWLDDENKCRICGEYKDSPKHSDLGAVMGQANIHPYQGSVNEVKNLYQRMKGLVLVQFKKDCLDLPDKTYETVTLKPTIDMVRSVNLIKAQSTKAIEILTNLRELSDGFLYKTRTCGNEKCFVCGGSGKKEDFVRISDEEKPTADLTEADFKKELRNCPTCEGTGRIDKYERYVEETDTPKIPYFESELEEMDDIGRYVVFAGFMASIDRLVRIAHQNGWATLRIDGRGLHGTDKDGTPIDKDILLDAMDASSKRRAELLAKYPKVVVVANPDAGGMAYTFTASPVALFYSNSFKGEARMQSEDRIHRAGMDTNRACIIRDIVMLKSDQLVIDNLKKKKDLQDLSLGALMKEIESVEV